MASETISKDTEKFFLSTEVSDGSDVVRRGESYSIEATRQGASTSRRGLRGKQIARHERGNRARHGVLYRQHVISCDNEGEKKRPSFCKAWCDMWFLLAQTRISCIGLTIFLFTCGILLIFLTAFGGLVHCPHLTGAAVFCILMAILSISLGFLCCCYHWVKDDDDLPFAIFCVAYCLLLLFQFVTIAGTVVVFTHIHPIGPNQPPPYSDTTVTSVVAESCGMTELPLGILVICYILAIGFVMMSYFACILALGASSDVEDD